MKRYFVKAIFGGWKEVDKEHYNAFVEHLRRCATNIPSSRIDDFIAIKTKVIESENRYLKKG